MTDQDREIGSLTAKVDALTATVNRMAKAQEEMRRELSELRGARKFALGVMAALGGASAIAGWLAHKFGPSLPTQ